MPVFKWEREKMGRESVTCSSSLFGRGALACILNACHQPTSAQVSIQSDISRAAQDAELTAYERCQLLKVSFVRRGHVRIDHVVQGVGNTQVGRLSENVSVSRCSSECNQKPVTSQDRAKRHTSPRASFNAARSSNSASVTSCCSWQNAAQSFLLTIECWSQYTTFDLGCRM